MMKFDMLFYYDADRVLASETKEFTSTAEAEAFVGDLLTNARSYTIRNGAKMHIVQLALVAKIELIDRAMQEKNILLDIF